jgi:hypothetical protein
VCVRGWECACFATCRRNHEGCSPNEYADVCAKGHLAAAEVEDVAGRIERVVTHESRRMEQHTPCMVGPHACMRAPRLFLGGSEFQHSEQGPRCLASRGVAVSSNRAVGRGHAESDREVHGSGGVGADGQGSV